MAITSKQEYIQVDGVKTFFVKAGDGHPMLLIHGASPGASSLINWKLNIEPLAAAGFAVYAYDQPGFGLSGIPSDHSMEFRVTHAKAFLAAIAPDRVHVVGNSMGAYMAARLALDHANVDRLVLVSSSTLAPKGSPKAAALAQTHVDELRGYEPDIEAMRAMTRVRRSSCSASCFWAASSFWAVKSSRTSTAPVVSSPRTG